VLLNEQELEQPAGAPGSRPCAYATLVTNEEYGLGALALARSLRWTGTTEPLVVLVTSEAEHVEELEREGCRIVPVRQPALSAEFRERHGREALHRAAPFNKGSKPAFHDPVDNFCKLELWKLVEYEKIVFLDADSLVVKPIDMLFGFPEFAGAPNVYETLADFHRLNSGVFVAEPSLATYARLVERLDRPGVFWRRTDQTFLETFFPDWHKLPYTFNTMQYVYFNLPELWVWKSIRVVHYQYEKPWSEQNPKRHLLQPVIDLWWQMFEGNAPPDDLPVLPPAVAEDLRA
jgi:alpha-N-acetylglucosamine transferase